MSEELREEMLDEMLINSRKFQKMTKAQSYKPSKYELNKIAQIKQIFDELSQIKA